MANRRLELIDVPGPTQKWLYADLSWLTVGDRNRGLVATTGGFAIVSAGLRDVPRLPRDRRHAITMFACVVGDDRAQLALSTCSSSVSECSPGKCGTAVIDLTTDSGEGSLSLRAEGALTDLDIIRQAIADVSEGLRNPDRDPRASRCAFGIMHALRVAGHTVGGVGLPSELVGDNEALAVMAEATSSLVMSFPIADALAPAA